MNRKKSVFKRVMPFMKKRKALAPIAMIMSALSAIFNIIPLYLLWKIASIVILNSEAVDKKQITIYAVMVLISILLGILSYWISLLLSHLAAFEVEMEIKKDGMKRILSMPLGYFSEETSGKLRNVVMDGSAKTHTLLAHQLPDLAATILTPILLIILMLLFDWRLGVASLIPIVLGVLTLSKMMSKEGMALQKEYFTMLEKMSDESVEYVRGIPVVKTFGQSIHSFKRFYSSINNYKEIVKTFSKLWSNPMSFYTAIIGTASYFLVPLAIIIIGNSTINYQIIVNVTLYLLLAPMFSIFVMRSMYFTQQITVATEAMDRYDEIFEYEMPKFTTQSAKTDGNNIELKNVSFTYPGAERKTIDNISISVNNGETLALVGPSGSGKTTIARLVARFWDADSGEVLIGKVSVKEYTKEDLMNKVSFVFQNNKLFKSSLRDNLTYGNSEASELDIKDALKLSRSTDIIDGLENGLDTIIGTKGTYLSGGEQQRIAIARAILKDAPIVLLDEATAFCDPENEHLIKEALNELSKGKTTIIIAHRLSTVKDADKIAVVDKGKIVETGTFKELIDKNGMFRKMWDDYQKSIEWKISKKEVY